MCWSPMPFGCVGFDARDDIHYDTHPAQPRLQCLSAVWALMPYRPVASAPVPKSGLQCLSAVWALMPKVYACDPVELTGVSNAFRLCGL